MARFGQQDLQVYQPPGPMQPQQRQQQLQVMRPMGGSPFDVMDQMLGPMGPGMGMGSLMGGMFQQMDMMMSQMDNQMAMGGGMGMMPMGAGGSQMMMMSSSGGGGTFTSQSMVMSQKIGPDGQVHTERYSSSSVGDQGRQIKEVQQAYSNSSTGVDKLSMERQMAEQGRKVVKERNRQSGEERSTTFFRGIEEDQAEEFDQRWRHQAAPHLPSHNAVPTQRVLSIGGQPPIVYGEGIRLAEGQARPLAIQAAPTSPQPTSQPRLLQAASSAASSVAGRPVEQRTVAYQPSPAGAVAGARRSRSRSSERPARRSRPTPRPGPPTSRQRYSGGESAPDPSRSVHVAR